MNIPSFVHSNVIFYTKVLINKILLLDIIILIYYYYIIIIILLSIISINTYLFNIYYLRIY